jgi:hypothetical protein
MTNITQIKSEKICFIFIEFAIGSTPQYIRYTDMAINYTLLGKQFSSVPNMEFTYPEQSGGLDEPVFKVDLPVNTFSLWLSGDEATSQVNVTVWEWQETEHDSSAKIRFRGTCSRAFRNFSGNKNVVRIEAENIKRYFDVPLGVQANHQCAWQVGHGGCTFPIATLKEQPTIATISRNTITVTGLTTTATDGYWRFGYIEKDGIRIPIRDYSTGSTIVLSQNPPPSWLRQQIDVYPGCSGDYSECSSKFANTNDFCGLGYAIPEYHPLIESP